MTYQQWQTRCYNIYLSHGYPPTVALACAVETWNITVEERGSVLGALQVSPEEAARSDIDDEGTSPLPSMRHSATQQIPGGAPYVAIEANRHID